MCPERENFSRAKRVFPLDGGHDPAAASPKTVQFTIESSSASFREHGDTCVHTLARTREHFTPDDRAPIRSPSSSFGLSPVRTFFRDTRTFLLVLEHLEDGPLV